MSDISRRTVLSGLGALGLAAAVSQSFTGWAHAAPPLTDAEFETLRQRWVDLITGRDQLEVGSPVFAAALATLDASIDTSLGLVDTTPGRSQVFTDQPLSADANVSGGYTRLAGLARGWATPGSRHHGSDAVLAVVLAGLQDLHRLVYHVGQAEYGNWWSWEIGASRALADTMATVRDHIDQADLDAYCAAIDWFVPDPWQQFRPPRAVVTSTGANRVDLCQAVIVRSIVGGDAARLSHAVAGLSDTWQYVTSGDGFFRDGSFVQHTTIGYTGTYGIVLLGGLSKLFALLAGSSHDVTDPSRSIIDQAVEGSYAPLVYRGQMMDAVRGRAVSRQNERSFADGDGAIEAVLRLARAVDPTLATRWRGLCRQWIEAGRTGSAQHEILTGASVVRTALVHDLFSSGIPARPDAGGPRLFPGMDRLVHRGADNRWALTVAMCSNRITWYECGNGENDRGAQTSSGMTYLYLDSADQHFDDEFWPTSDLTAPPGTTVDTVVLPPKVEGEWGARCPQNEWTGGSVLGEWSLAGQHLIGPGATGLTARKTWFAGPDFVACLGSDISCFPQTSQTRVPVAADAHVNDGSKADTNAGASGTLLVKATTGANSGYNRQTFLKFTPPAVTGDLAAVTLNLYARVNDSAGTTDIVTVARTGDFVEGSVTWNNKPTIGESVATAAIGGSFAWVAVDVTAAVRDQVVAGQPITLAIVENLAAGSLGRSVEIKSKEAGASTAAYLSVDVRTGQDGRTRSVVEHRNTGTTAGRLVVDRKQVTTEQRLVDPQWAHLTGTGGYVFLAPAVVAASVQPRSGTWRSVNTGGSTTELTRHYATLQVRHPESGRGSYAYLLLPGATEALTRARAAKPPVTVVANTAQVQAVTAGIVTGANFWQAGAAAGITADRPASVLAKRTPGMAAVAVSDPTHAATTVVVEFADAPWTRITGTRVTMARQGTTVRVSVDVTDRGGVPVEFQLHKG